jgi:hypothetical protein
MVIGLLSLAPTREKRLESEADWEKKKGLECGFWSKVLSHIIPARMVAGGDVIGKMEKSLEVRCLEIEFWDGDPPRSLRFLQVNFVNELQAAI